MYELNGLAESCEEPYGVYKAQDSPLRIGALGVESEPTVLAWMLTSFGKRVCLLE